MGGSDATRPSLNEKLFPVHRPSGLKRADWNVCFFIFKKNIFLNFFLLYILVYTNMKLGGGEIPVFFMTGND